MPRTKHDLKILYVEDDPETRDEMARFLKNRFRKVLVAENGRQGLALFSDETPDILIVDLVMEDIGGIQMVEEIRALGSPCPVIITSALDDSSTILRSVDLGIVTYLVKPLDTDKLDETLEGLARTLGNARPAWNRLGPEERNAALKRIRSAAASLLKNRSGRGPLAVEARFLDQGLEIVVRGGLTSMEKTLLSVPGNRAVVEQTRHLFHKALKDDWEREIGEPLGTAVRLVEDRLQEGSEVERLFFGIVGTNPLLPFPSIP